LWHIPICGHVALAILTGEPAENGTTARKLSKNEEINRSEGDYQCGWR
ncbi:uncharacterized, partial [Tachysurus ichikawai]